MHLNRLLIIVQEPVQVFAHRVQLDVKVLAKDVRVAVRMAVKTHVVADVDKLAKEVVSRCVNLIAREVVNLHVGAYVEGVA